MAKNENLEFLSKSEVLDLLKLDERTYHLYISKGILKPYRPTEESKKFLFKKKEIEEVFKPTVTTKIVSFVNQKGGVGKTTFTLNLGVGLSLRQYRVLLIDMDSQGNLTAALGLKEDSIAVENSAVMIFEEKEYQAKDIITQINDNLHLVPASIVLDAVDKKSDLNDYFKLKKFVQRVFKNYDFIFIDCRPSLGTLTMNGLIGSEYILIPVEPDFYSPLGMKQLIKTINESKEFNPILKILGAVINKKDERTNVAKDVTEDLKKALGDIIFNTEINLNTKIKEAPFFSKSVLEYDKSSVGANDYRNLIEEFLSKIKG